MGNDANIRMDSNDANVITNETNNNLYHASKHSFHSHTFAYLHRFSFVDLHRYALNSPSHLAITTVAKQFPIRFTEVRAMSMSSSMPRMMKMGQTGSPNDAAVPSNITNEARGTPATPLLVTISVSTMNSCSFQVISMPATCATNTDASERYNVVPSRLKL